MRKCTFRSIFSFSISPSKKWEEKHGFGCCQPSFSSPFLIWSAANWSSLFSQDQGPAGIYFSPAKCDCWHLTVVPMEASLPRMQSIISLLQPLQWERSDKAISSSGGCTYGQRWSPILRCMWVFIILPMFFSGAFWGLFSVGWPSGYAPSPYLYGIKYEWITDSFLSDPAEWIFFHGWDRSRISPQSPLRRTIQ